jgi:Plasmid stabilization system protein
MRVRWLKTAGKNLDAAMDHIARDNPELAVTIYNHIRARVDDLREQPSQGRPGRVFGTRELVLEKYPFIVPYRVKNNEIQILRVFHTSRKPPDKW